MAILEAVSGVCFLIWSQCVQGWPAFLFSFLIFFFLFKNTHSFLSLSWRGSCLYLRTSSSSHFLSAEEVILERPRTPCSSKADLSFFFFFFPLPFFHKFISMSLQGFYAFWVVIQALCAGGLWSSSLKYHNDLCCT